jgi:transposase InsO family protein
MRAAGAIHHSDQGSQYTSFAFTRLLAAEGIVASMGTVGDALDNAMCESLIGTMKIEKSAGSHGAPPRTSAPPSSNGSRPRTTAATGTPASPTSHP